MFLKIKLYVYIIEVESLFNFFKYIYTYTDLVINMTI